MPAPRSAYRSTRPRPRVRLPWPDVLSLLAAASAIAGWVHFEQTTDVGMSLAFFGGAFIALGLLQPLVQALSAVDSYRRTLTRLRAARRSDPYREQFGALFAPNRSALLCPAVLVPVMAATLPIAFHTMPGDWSILTAGVAFVVFAGYGCLLFGFCGWLLVLGPLVLLFAALGRVVLRGRADSAEKFGIGLGLLLLCVVTFATTLVLSTGHAAHGSDTRRARTADLATLFGAGGGVQHPALLWIARAALIAMIVVGVALYRIGRPRARR